MKRILRPYQEDCLQAVLDQLASVDSTLAVLPTGCGKTVLFAALADRWTLDRGRVLIVAHREELIRQAADKIADETGERPGIEMGFERIDESSSFGPKHPIVVTSVQTMSRPNRHSKFHPDDFGLVVIDEAHHAVASQYQAVLAHFRHAKVLGVTATPNRKDECALGQVFQTVAYSYPLEQAIDAGWLVPIRQQVVRVHGLDFSKVKVTAGDLNEGELDAILTQEEMLHKMAAPVIDVIGDRSTLIFCATVNHAEKMAELLGKRYKPGSAQALSGKSSWEERKKTVDRFRSGDLQILCNCSLFLEGFDAPNTAVVVLARPTKSLPLFTQMIGRGTRTLPGVVDGLDTDAQRREAILGSAKPHMLVMDLKGNSGRHKLCEMEDLLGGKWAMPVRAYAAQTAAAEGGEQDVARGLERAEAEMELLREQEDLDRKRNIVAKASFYLQDVSPFAHGDVTPAPRPEPTGERATPGQVRYLCFLGIKKAKAEMMSKKQAGFWINKLKNGERVGA